MIYEYDGRNEKCPLPLVKTRVILKKMTSGDRCIIYIADSGSLSDIPKFLDKLEYSYTQKQLENSVVCIEILHR